MYLHILLDGLSYGSDELIAWRCVRKVIWHFTDVNHPGSDVRLDPAIGLDKGDLYVGREVFLQENTY